MKTCTRCKESKPLAQFPPRKISRDGLHSHCRVCTQWYKTQWLKRREAEGYPDILPRVTIPDAHGNRGRISPHFKRSLAMDVYLDEHRHARVRGVREGSRRDKVQPHWAMVGRYVRPFDIRQILEDIAAT